MSLLVHVLNANTIFYAYELNRYYSEFKNETLTRKHFILNNAYYFAYTFSS